MPALRQPSARAASDAISALLFLLFVWTALPANAAAPSAQVVTDHVRTDLIAHAPAGIAPGKELMLGLKFVHQPGWHTYWKNPGDSGLPIVLDWTLPPGVEAGDIRWPAPVPLRVGPLMNYGYEHDTVLPVVVQVPAGFKEAHLDVTLRAEWLVCKEICIPEEGEYVLRVPAATPTVAHAAAFKAALAAEPVSSDQIQARVRVAGAAMAIEVSGLPAQVRGATFDHFPEEIGVFKYAAPVTQKWDGERLLLEVPLAAQRSESPGALKSVLVARNSGQAFAIGGAIEGGWPAAVTPAAASPAAAATPAAPTVERAFLVTLLLAFAGGALLNLMPCVFPVLAIKVLGFANHAGDRRAAAVGGLAYSAGVIASFTLLALLLLALRAAGEQLGWGFQLQSPLVVSALALLFTLIGLNLAGVFEFGSVLPSGVASLRASHPRIDDALSGVLAVAIASPCTAPFMGAALGAALTQSAPMALLLFAVLGAGMAFPYLLASLWPGFARALPRPGPWMVRFKVIMAFPMFATVVWLVWVLGQQAGIDGVAALLGLLVAAAFAAWALATPASVGGRRALAATAAVLLVAVGAWAWPSLHGAVPSAPGAPSAGWQPWSEQAVADARGKGQPVFVDFTAAWCVTCQVNKRTTLADDSVVRDFADKGVLLLRADWTRRDEAITRELARHGRNGVPVYLYYGKAAAGPQLLSELLTVDDVRAALAKN